MTRSALLAASLVAVAGLAPLAAHAGTELIANGGFETTSTASANGNFQLSSSAQAQFGTVAGWTTTAGPTNSNPYNVLFRTNAPGNTSASNANQAETTSTAYSPSAAASRAWTQYSNTSDNSSGNERLVAGYNMTSPVGGNFMALDGDTNVNGYLSQSVSGLAVGGYYALNFWWAATMMATAPSTPQGITEKLQVTFGNSTQTTATLSAPDQGFSGWYKATMYFTANATTQTLSFLSIGTPNGAPPLALLDGVSLQSALAQSVPEPASIALVGAGIAGLTLLRRRRGAKTTA